ncbi:MAG: TolC family protein, partial [Rhodobacteraceae bacterium]|nr:TolC family protein [Paracoccaceae bacterium]
EGETFAARNDQSDAEIALAEAVAGLQRYAGADVTGVSMDGNRIGVVDLGNLDQTLTRERLLDMSPDLQAARAALDVASRTVRVAKGASQPSANMVLDLEQEKTEGSLFGGGSDTQTTSLGMAFSVPIYNGGINKSRVREAEAKVKGATLRVKQTEAAVVSHYDALMKAAASTAQRTASISRQLNLVEQSLKAATEQVASGRASDDVRLEQALRRDVTRLDLQAARLQQLRIQAELYALFGALDVKALSGQAG